jgi:hypothetical protein
VELHRGNETPSARGREDGTETAWLDQVTEADYRAAATGAG